MAQVPRQHERPAKSEPSGAVLLFIGCGCVLVYVLAEFGKTEFLQLRTGRPEFLVVGAVFIAASFVVDALGVVAAKLPPPRARSTTTAPPAAKSKTLPPPARRH